MRKKSNTNKSGIAVNDTTNNNIILNISSNINPEDLLSIKGDLEELEPSILLSYEPFIPFIGEDGLKKLFSRHVLWKEEGLEEFMKKLDEIINEKNENLNHLINLNMKLISIFLSEKHPQITLRSLELFENTLIIMKNLNMSSLNKNSANLNNSIINNSNLNISNIRNNNTVSKSEKMNYDFNSTENILIRIKEKLGEVSFKLRNKAIDLYCFMLKQNFCDYNNLLSELLEEEFRHIDSKKIQKSYKVILGKLRIFENVFEEFDTAVCEKRTDLNTFPLQNILNYTVENLGHSKSDVRKLAKKILLKINLIFGFKKIENSLAKKGEERELEKLSNEIPEITELIKVIQVNKLKMPQHSPRGKSSGISVGSSGLDKKRSQEKKNNKNSNKFNKSIIEKSETESNNINIDKESNILKNDKENANNRKPKVKPVEAPIEKIKNLICSYCGKTDKKFTSQNRIEEHLSTECLLFSNCIKCLKNMEIRLLNNHMLSECSFKSDFKLCKRCKEAVLISAYETHIKDNTCNPAKNINSCNRCPLCHKDVPPLDKGFVQHLVNDGCPNYKRK